VTTTKDTWGNTCREREGGRGWDGRNDRRVTSFYEISQVPLRGGVRIGGKVAPEANKGLKERGPISQTKYIYLHQRGPFLGTGEHAKSWGQEKARQTLENNEQVARNNQRGLGPGLKDCKSRETIQRVCYRALGQGEGR